VPAMRARKARRLPARNALACEAGGGGSADIGENLRPNVLIYFLFQDKEVSASLSTWKVVRDSFTDPEI
jgi:hypothetical protein